LLERSQVRIPLEPHLCFFNLILARRGMHVGMGNGICGEGGMRKTMRGGGNGNCRTLATRNGSREWEWALRGGENEKDSAGMGMAEHGMAAYPLPP
jgi:hypothetical protein